MTVTQHKGFSAYREARINEFEQSELILMMYSGAVNFLEKALAASNNKLEMGQYVMKAKKILLELMASLNIEDSGEIGRLLLNTYSRQYHTLHAAHLTDDVNKIGLVRDSLIELEDAWKQVFKSEEYLNFKNQRRNANKPSGFFLKG